jgi:2-methylcitrate dehydratase PrpD
MVPARAAALANGAASHALDYDDTHFAHVGHPSVTVLPAALAVAVDAPASAELDALLIGRRPRSASAWSWEEAHERQDDLRHAVRVRLSVAD